MREPINLQIQEAKKTPSRLQRQPHLGALSKTAKIKDKEEILRATREKKMILYILGNNNTNYSHLS